MAIRIGIDLGGTKIEGLLLDADGVERARKRLVTPQHDYEGGIRAIVNLVAELELSAKSKADHIGVGMPGALSPTTGLVMNANSTWLNGRPFDRDLQQVLGRPVRFSNDANCLAVSEATDGAGAGMESVFAIILGTGVGGGFVHLGRLLEGANRIAGEWGHNPLPWPSESEWPGHDCYCGKRGCIETYLSGPALTRDYSVDEALKAEVILQRAIDGEAKAKATLDRYFDRLAKSLAMVINILDPQVVVIGGGLSNIEMLYDELPARLPKYVFSDQVRTKITKAMHGDSSGVRGAAWL